VAENFRGIAMYVPSVYRWKDLDEQDLMKFLSLERSRQAGFNGIFIW
jgi:hypothetical protein